MAKKRVVSFLLALTMMLGIFANPVFAASSSPSEKKEVNYEIQEINGKSYKAYKISDLGLKHPEKLIAPKYRARKAGDPMEDWVKVQVESHTTGLTLGGDFDLDVYVALRKDDTKIAKAHLDATEEIVKHRIYHFVKTDAYDETNPDHKDPDKWYLLVPSDLRYDVRIYVRDGGNFGDENVQLVVGQRAMPLYKAVWFTNKEDRPVVNALYNDGDNRPNEVQLNNTDFAENEYKSVSDAPGDLYVGQKLVEVKNENRGIVPRQKFKISDMKGAILWKLEIEQGGVKKTKGTIEDGDTKYHFNITGDYKTPFVATMRQELNVKFDPNGATFAQDVKAEQPIGHSMKIGEAFGDLKAVTVPTKDQISNIPQKNNKDQDLVGWVTDVANKDLDYSNGQNRDKLVNPNGYEVKDNVTFYAVYAPKDQGKVAIQYVNQDGRAIDDKYKIKGEDYPKYAEGNKGEDLEASKVPEPTFIGYKRVPDDKGGKIDVTGKTYKTEQIETVEVKYEKLPDIIPEKKNGQDNPDVTPEVKQHYAKLTFQVAPADDKKAKLQLDNADATSPLVYYVNPLEGKKIKDVADVKALSKDDNLYKVDANDMWTFKPESINSTDQEIMQARDDQDNVVKTEITLTAKVADTDAKKYGDKLKAQDIVKWVGEDVDWKDGVQKIDGVTFKNVEDLGNRNTTNAGVFPGKLKVTFNDDSTKEIDGQRLIVRAKKGDKVTPDDKDPGTYPKDALEVKFAKGTGIDKLDPANKVMVLQKDEALEANDYPTVTVKANHETKANNVDYYDVQPGKLTAKETTITASTTEKGKKDVEFSFEFYNSKKPTEQIPASVLKGKFEPTVPEKQTGKYVGSDITLPTFEDVKVTTGDLQGTWKFDGWYRNGNKVTDPKVSANDAENNLVGKWILEETKTAKVTREFAIDPAIVGDGKDVPAGHALPSDVTKQKPNDTTNYIGSEQTPGKDKFKAVPEKIGEKEGTWTFKAWDKAKLTVDANEAMNKFTGTWTWTEKGKINIKYVFKAVGTDKALPKEILDQKPADTSGYQAPADPTLPAVASHDVIVNGDKVGTWTRGNKWSKEVDDNGNITYTLTWTFEETRSDKPTIDPVKPGDKTIEGKGKPGSKIKVTIPGVKDPIETEVGKDGKWKVDVPENKKLKEGEVIKATQKTEGLPESKETEITVRGDEPVVPVEPKKRDDYINLVPVGETEPSRATDIHVLYLYGYQDKTVHPQGDMTRAEAAAMVARLKNLDMSDTSKPDFKDCESRWYNSAINAVVKAGLMKGYPDGTFAPNGKITRAEFAQLIKGIDLANSAELPFTDVAGHWGIGAISQAYANKRIMGYPDNTFKPNNDITRAEAVTILNSLFDRGINEAGLANVRKDIVEFKDLDRSHWAYYQIIEASNTHEFYRAKDGEVPEVWVRVLKTWNDFLK